MFVSKATLLALLPFLLELPATTTAQASGSGKTTRYWDCCKPSCSWSGKVSLASGATPVRTCDRNDNPLSTFDVKSGCEGGNSYMCTDQTPWAINDDLSYGFAAVSLAGGTEASWCCACYELTFTSGPVAGKKFVVQTTNTGGDLGNNHFDLAIPGGGFGIFNGCTNQFGTPSTGWGQQYGGVSSRSQCDAFDARLKPGCYWRFDWFKNADNPDVSFRQVTCPAALTNKTGCVRNGETPGNEPLPTTTSARSTTAAGTTSARTSAATTSATTTTRATTAAQSTTTAGNTGGTAAQWAQCGGRGYTGPTTCASPYKCVVTNEWYSQCI